jgi:hypothetical protein
MTELCPTLELDEVFAPDTPDARRDELRAHAAACVACGQELLLLTAERARFRARQEQEPAVPAALWHRTRARLGEPRLIVRWWQSAGRGVVWALGGAMLAAAAATLWLSPRMNDQARPAAPLHARAPRRDPLRALVQAEELNRAAIAQLERDYLARSGRRGEDRLRALRTELANATPRDLGARTQVLFASSEYLSSLESIVLEETP